MAVLHGNDAFSILVLPIKKRHSSFLEKVFVFKYLISTDWQIKACQSLNRRAILKIAGTGFLEETMFFLFALRRNF